jgi:hypothetical protein
LVATFVQVGTAWLYRDKRVVGVFVRWYFARVDWSAWDQRAAGLRLCKRRMSGAR